MNPIYKKLTIIEAVIFLVAGVITVIIGKFAIDNYGTILLLCGLATMAIAIVTQAGSRHRLMPYSYRSKISVSQQHLREKKAMQSDNTFFLYSFIVGIIPVGVGLILMQIS
jgi:hypothetical protein